MMGIRGVRRVIGEASHPRRLFRDLMGPGAPGWIAKTLDHLAVRRVRQAIIEKTNDTLTARWLGRPMWQYPLDAWIMQEVVGELKPDIIVETGTWFGGSAYFFASLCDLLNQGEVISIDIAARGTVEHPRITYLQGSSTDPIIVASVAQRVRQSATQRVLVVLDSDHRTHHVRQELEAYSPLVPVGSYIHVQDGNIDELPRFRGGRPGPLVAVKAFLKNHPQFVRDTDVELRYVMTEHPYGWLKRVASDAM